MSFRKIDEWTSEYQTILKQLVPPTKKLNEKLWSDRYEIYLSNDKGAFFYRQYCHVVREWDLCKSELRIGKAIFQIKYREQYVGRKNEIKISLIEAISNVSVTTRMRTKARRSLLELAPVLGKVKRGFKILITDKTKLPKPRSLSNLIQILNKVSASLCREHLIYCQSIFLWFMADEELTLIKNHIVTKHGKGLTLLSILFFEVGFERRIFRSDNNLKLPLVPEGKTSFGADAVTGDM